MYPSPVITEKRGMSVNFTGHSTFSGSLANDAGVKSSLASDFRTMTALQGEKIRRSEQKLKRRTIVRQALTEVEAASYSEDRCSHKEHIRNDGHVRKERPREEDKSVERAEEHDSPYGDHDESG